ncbi:MAG: hypothetical protein QM820_14905 [Minicystis sp.]
MKDVLARLRATVPPRAFGELATALTVTARQRGLREVILSVLSKEDVMQSSVYALGKQDGLEEGAQKGQEEMAAQLYELRLGRALTENERNTLKQRLQKLGTARLLRVQQEVSPDVLAAWLADPNAT